MVNQAEHKIIQYEVDVSYSTPPPSCYAASLLFFCFFQVWLSAAAGRSLEEVTPMLLPARFGTFRNKPRASPTVSRVSRFPLPSARGTRTSTEGRSTNTGPLEHRIFRGLILPIYAELCDTSIRPPPLDLNDTNLRFYPIQGMICATDVVATTTIGGGGCT